MSVAPNGKSKPLYDPVAVADAVELLVVPGQVTELRVLEATTASDRWSHTASGYFDDAAKLVQALASIKTAKGIYLIPNPVDPALLARAANRLRKPPKEESTSDTNIVSRQYLLIDTDAQRPAGISATDAEHVSAIERAQAICDYLGDRGWPKPVVADSGNGGHLIYRIDMPADDGGLIQRCLAALAARFDDEAVTVDQTVYNPARIWKLYGTLACKGDDTADRPHRMARILSRPTELAVVDAPLLEALAAECMPAAIGVECHTGNCKSFDLQAFIVRNSLDTVGPNPWNGKQGPGRQWTLRTSPMCEHHDDAAHIEQHASGAISAGCHHNSCNWGWTDLRARLEPKS